MKISKQILLITPILFIFFASGCSTSLLQPDYAESFLPEKGEDMVVPLLRDEEGHRLSFRSSDRLKGIHFAFDKYDLDGKLRAILAENVAYLKSHPESKIEIQGHCDARGSEKYNISLAERRVHSTKSYLILLGVDESRIHSIIYGEEKPICTESNKKCWYQNRSVRFLVTE